MDFIIIIIIDHYGIEILLTSHHTMHVCQVRPNSPGDSIKSFFKLTPELIRSLFVRNEQVV